MVEKEGKTTQSPFPQSERPSSELVQSHLNLRRASGDSSPHKVLYFFISFASYHFTTQFRAQDELRQLTHLFSRALVLPPNPHIHLLVLPSLPPTQTPHATLPRGLTSFTLVHPPLSNLPTGVPILPTVHILVRASRFLPLPS
jgi:hypothetical protein